MVEGPDLSEVWLYYMDHFADQQAFIELGDRAENQFLEAIIKTLCQKLFGRTVHIAEYMLIHIPEQQFYHGPVHVEGRIGGIIYAEDKKVGILAISADSPPTDEVKYVRFSKPMEMPPRPANPDLN
jgi:hypothetical protein